VLTLDRITKTFTLPGGGRLELLRRVDLELTAGEVVSITGRSGSGKSTLLNILGLMDKPDGGGYQIDKREVTRLNDRDASSLRGSHFGFVFQQFNLLDRRTALQNVLAPLHHAPWSEYKKQRDKAEGLLAEVGLAERMGLHVSKLSVGEQQRVAIARSVIREPKWILVDEPTGSLDIQTGRLVMSVLLQLAASAGRGLVIVTHDPAIADLADRHFVIEDGVLVPAV
jgi:putative ABC transport system ATP-binding protein